MVVRRNGRQHRVYYHCSKYFKRWVEHPCGYAKFIPGDWGDVIWNDICTLLSDDSWLDREIHRKQSEAPATDKLIRLEESKIAKARARVGRVQEGFEGGLYTLQDAKLRIESHQETIAKVQAEILRLRSLAGHSTLEEAGAEAIRDELVRMRDRRLDLATFQEKVDLISWMEIEVHPAEDLRSMKVKCRLGGKQHVGHTRDQASSYLDGKAQTGWGKVPYVPPYRDKGNFSRRPSYWPSESRQVDFLVLVASLLGTRLAGLRVAVIGGVF
jgi:hypothetical protein